MAPNWGVHARLGSRCALDCLLVRGKSGVRLPFPPANHGVAVRSKRASVFHAGTYALDALDKPNTPTAERPKVAVGGPSVRG